VLIVKEIKFARIEV